VSGCVASLASFVAMIVPNSFVRPSAKARSWQTRGKGLREACFTLYEKAGLTENLCGRCASCTHHIRISSNIRRIVIATTWDGSKWLAFLLIGESSIHCPQSLRSSFGLGNPTAIWRWHNCPLLLGRASKSTGIA